MLKLKGAIGPICIIGNPKDFSNSSSLKPKGYNRPYKALIRPSGPYKGFIRPPEALLYLESPSPLGYNKSCPAMIFKGPKIGTAEIYTITRLCSAFQRDSL